MRAEQKWRRLLTAAQVCRLDNGEPLSYVLSSGTSPQETEGTAAVGDDELFQSFYLHCRVKNLRPATLRFYADGLEVLLRWSRVRRVSVGTLRKEDVEAYILEALDSGLSAHTINARLRAWRRFYGYCCAEKLLDNNLMERVKLLRADEKQPKILTPEQVQVLLNQFHRKIFYAQRNRCILLVLLDSMIRVGELTRLRIIDIDLIGGTLAIHHTKSRRERRVPISPVTAHAIHKYLKQYREQRAGDHLFPYDDGRPMRKEEVRQILARAGKRCGLHVYPHLIRHTGATWYIKDGGHAPILQRLLGHADFRTTERYIHLAGKDLLEEHYRHSPINRLTKGA